MAKLKACLERAVGIEAHLHGKFQRDRTFVSKNNSVATPRRYTNENGVPINRPVYPAPRYPTNKSDDGKWDEENPGFENLIRLYEDCA